MFDDILHNNRGFIKSGIELIDDLWKLREERTYGGVRYPDSTDDIRFTKSYWQGEFIYRKRDFLDLLKAENAIMLNLYSESRFSSNNRSPLNESSINYSQNKFDDRERKVGDLQQFGSIYTHESDFDSFLKRQEQRKELEEMQKRGLDYLDHIGNISKNIEDKDCYR